MVVVSSMCSTRGYAEQMTYCVSKAAVDHFVRCLAIGNYALYVIVLRVIFYVIIKRFIEMAPHKVRINSVNPGGVVTNILMANEACKDREEEQKVYLNFSINY